jgi:NDP-sugar pyrophosphorylase family protein
LGLTPEECIIVEDSDVGKKAATDSGGILCSVNNPYEVNYYRVLRTIMTAERINFVIPAAGQGKRFSEVGYQHPKPLIDVAGKPMIQLVIENLNGTGRPLVLMQKKHIDQYCANDIIKFIKPSAEIIPVDGLTEGAVCTVLLAREYINNESEMLIANSDQLVDINLEEFIMAMREKSADGGMITFKASEDKWSYARYDEDGKVSEVAEKKAISDQATVGVYYYKRGAEFVKYAEQMVRKDIRVNGEFYVCPVFNEFIEDGKSIYIYEIEKDMMHGLGTPEDLNIYLENKA